ncbi:hypothetical protein [Streptomyces chartreusis]|uniref:hypothetical protein n=1 Tax=Streptomyces chartreusis TaxID=1969 RepID=UPI00340796E2
MLTEEDARQLVLAKIDGERGNVEYDLHGTARDSALDWGATVLSWWIAKTSG